MGLTGIVGHSTSMISGSEIIPDAKVIDGSGMSTRIGGKVYTSTFESFVEEWNSFAEFGYEQSNSGLICSLSLVLYVT